MVVSRIRKEAEVRQTELVDAALELFSSVGYEKAMIVDIVKKIGVAKGTFYYYFPTKEAVLEAICMRWSNELAASFQAESRCFSALEKLQSFIAQHFRSSRFDLLFEKLWEEKQFDLLYQIWKNQTENVFNPLLAKIIRQGHEEGSMCVEHCDEAITFIWSILDCLWEANYYKDPFEVICNKVKIAEGVLERILGIEEGLVKIRLLQNEIA